MAFSTLVPSSRQYSPGNWPVKTYNSQSGTEVRILFGSLQFNLQINLTYSNIPDAEAESFLGHYLSKNGTYQAFNLTTAEANAIFGGWAGTPAALREPTGVEWRYEKPPNIESVVPGVSTVSVTLRGVI